MTRKTSLASKSVAKAKKAGRKVSSTAKKTTGKVKSRKTKAVDKSKQHKLYSNRRDKRKGKRDSKFRVKAERKAQMPKSRVKRLLWRLHPKRLFAYWFSKKGMIMALKIAGLGFAVMIIVFLGIFWYFTRDLKDPRTVDYRGRTTKIYDRTGKQQLWELYGAENRTVVEFDQINNNVKWATVALEDKDFYAHAGVDFSAVGRAALANITGGAGTQGGSTITQQFVKNSLLSSERTFTRKIKEVFLAVQLERLYSKDEILAFYLNEIPYGAQEYGIEAAAQSFFKKSAKQLSVDEAAFLASLPQAPSYYSPYGPNTAELEAKKDRVIDAMLDQGYIDEEKAEIAKKRNTISKITPVGQRSAELGLKAPHFTKAALAQVEAEFGESLVQTGGLRIYTTLDWRAQRAAEKAVKDNIGTVVSPISGGSGDNVALSATDNSTGQVIAQVGSRDYNHPGYGNVNSALTPQQPGSSFKPYEYAELFKNERWGPDSLIYDVPTTFSEYKPTNYDFGYRGQMKVREALGASRNIPAVKATYIAGVENTANLAHSMGVDYLGNEDQAGLSMGLGANEVYLAEHVHAYSVFANKGIHHEQTYVLKVENSDGEILWEYDKDKKKRAVDEQIAYLISNVLADVPARGPFAGITYMQPTGVTVAAKTGTTNDVRDGWLMGYSKYIAAGVWVGNHDNAPMGSIQVDQSGPVWRQFMEDYHKNKEQVPIYAEAPEGIQKVRMDGSTGYAAGPTSSNTYWGEFPSWYKRQTSSQQQKVTIDTISNKLATECTPPAAKKIATSGVQWPEILPEDPFFGAWAPQAGYSGSGGRYSRTKDDVHKCSDKLPGVSLSITELGSGVYRIVANVTKGTHALDQLNFRVNGQIVSAQRATSPGSYDYTHTFTSKGTKSVVAEVVDKVLYSSSTTRSVNVTSVDPGSGISMISPTGGSSVTSPVTFNWEADSNADKYQLCYQKDAEPTKCKTTASTSLTESLDPLSSYTAWVNSLLGGTTLQTTGSVSFTTN